MLERAVQCGSSHGGTARQPTVISTCADSFGRADVASACPPWISLSEGARSIRVLPLLAQRSFSERTLQQCIAFTNMGDG